MERLKEFCLQCETNGSSGDTSSNLEAHATGSRLHLKNYKSWLEEAKYILGHTDSTDDDGCSPDALTESDSDDELKIEDDKGKRTKKQAGSTSSDERRKKVKARRMKKETRYGYHVAVLREDGMPVTMEHSRHIENQIINRMDEEMRKPEVIRQIEAGLGGGPQYENTCLMEEGWFLIICSNMYSKVWTMNTKIGMCGTAAFYMVDIERLLLQSPEPEREEDGDSVEYAPLS